MNLLKHWKLLDFLLGAGWCKCFAVPLMEDTLWDFFSLEKYPSLLMHDFTKLIMNRFKNKVEEFVIVCFNEVDAVRCIDKAIPSAFTLELFLFIP